MIGTAAVGAGMGAYQTIQGAKEQADAKQALANYQRQTLTNPYDNMQVSTLGADAQREEQARLEASQVQALAEGGTRGIVGGLGRVEAGGQLVNSKIGANLDEQQKAINMAQAEDQARIRQMMEARQNGDISALSTQFNAGKNDMNMGLGNMVRGVGMMANNYKPSTDPATTTPATNVNNGYTTSNNMNGVVDNVNTAYQDPASYRFNYPFGQIQGAPNY